MIENVFIFTNVILTVAVLIAISILWNENRAKTTERNAWIAGFAYLEENPLDAEEALNIVQNRLKELPSIRAALSLRQRNRK